MTTPSAALRSVALAVPALALLVSGCNRDSLAPDCFEIDPNTGECLIPDPGGTDVGGGVVVTAGAFVEPMTVTVSGGARHVVSPQRCSAVQ